MNNNHIDRDISLYFHIPFCSKKCPYCHFFVISNEERFKQPFVEALLQEWALRLPELHGKRILSIYFGGGTPTKLRIDHYQLILEKIYQSGVELASDCEITLEANPEDVHPFFIQQLKLLGINRISLGLQSLNDQELITLGRSHNANHAMNAVKMVREAGIVNISVDLMFELPGQSLQTWEKTLRAVCDLPMTHLSLYNLTIEPQTVFFKQRQQLLPQLPSEEMRLQMLQMAVQSFETIGLTRYEISAFAYAGMQSKHNSGYWIGRPFMGFGPSAFSYWEGARFSNVSHFNQYLQKMQQGCLAVDFKECLSYPQNLQELLAIRLRLLQGVDLTQFIATYGPLPITIEISVNKLIERNWVERRGSYLQLTALGQLFYDSVATELI